MSGFSGRILMDRRRPHMKQYQEMTREELQAQRELLEQAGG